MLNQFIPNRESYYIFLSKVCKFSFKKIYLTVSEIVMITLAKVKLPHGRQSVGQSARSNGRRG